MNEPTKIALMIGLMIASAAVGYFLGSLNFAIMLSKRFHHEDVREHGSGNAGATNMLRTYGKGMAALTLVGDMLKCAIAILIGALLWVDGAYIAGLFCVIGHVFPCWFHFRGGKGVAVAAAVILMTSPIVFLLVILVFAVIVLSTKYVSLASVMAALVYPVFLSSMNTVSGNEGSFNIIMAFLITTIVVVMHRQNIKRLLDKTEPKISLGKKKKQVEDVENDESADDAEQTQQMTANYKRYQNKKSKKGNK
ncbi:MAG: glycerol-3-phosphate 1-O-acyltransferase PlsY [Clostridia bacterium]|nr:glycerol-3-phosphate 1-O-acyltransferase PlsY [Clostridia bacterium]